MNHKNILSKGNRRIAIGFIIFVGLGLSLLVPGNPFRPLLSRNGFSSVSLFEYQAANQNTHNALKIVQGKAIEKNSQGQLFLSSKNKAWLGIPFFVEKKSVVNFYMNAWSVEETEVHVALWDATSQKEISLAHESSVRNRSFNLTSHLVDEHTYWIRISPELKNDSGRILLESMRLVAIPQVSSFPRIDLILLLAFLVFLYSNQKRDPFPPWIVGLGVVVLGFSMRWAELGASLGLSLNGDALGFYRLTENFSWLKPFHTGIREPFFIWYQSVIGTLLGLTQFHFRLGSLILSVTLVGVVFSWIYSRTKNLWASGVGGLLLALGHFFVFNGIRGERVELFVLLGLFFLLYLNKGRKADRQEIFLAGLAALFSLTWLIGLFISTSIYAFKAIKLKWPVKRVMLFAISLCIFVLPHLIVQWSENKDPLMSLNAHTNFYKNAKEKGVPSYEGEKTGLITYILKENGVGATLMDSIKGYGNLIFNPNFPLNRIFLGFHYTQVLAWVLFPFLLIGIGVSAWKRDYWIFIYLFCFLNVSVAFLNEIRDPRLFLHAAPFFGYFLGLGISQARTQGIKILNKVPNR